MNHPHDSLQARPHSQSQLIVDDLFAWIAPLDMYGLAKLSSAMVDSLVVLAVASGKGLHALRAQPIYRR